MKTKSVKIVVHKLIYLVASQYIGICLNDFFKGEAALFHYVSSFACIFIKKKFLNSVFLRKIDRILPFKKPQKHKE